jgi:hypothetical protein
LTNTAGTTTNNGSISGAVTVGGGTFKGTGSSAGLTIADGAVFAPGNGRPGTLATVNVSLAFSSRAFYQVAINPTTASFVSATSTATLGGSSVQAFFSSGTYVAKQYTILDAAGGVNGTFNTLANTNLPSGFTSTLSYDGTHAYLDTGVSDVGARRASFGGNGGWSRIGFLFREDPNSLTGRHVTDQQMRHFMNLCRNHSPAIAAAKAGFSTSAACNPPELSRLAIQCQASSRTSAPDASLLTVRCAEGTLGESILSGPTLMRIKLSLVF